MKRLDAGKVFIEVLPPASVAPVTQSHNRNDNEADQDENSTDEPEPCSFHALKIWTARNNARKMFDMSE